MLNLKQVIRKNIGRLLSRLINNDIQVFINDRYNKEGYSTIKNIFIEDLYYSYLGFDFIVTDQSDSIFEVPRHYDISDIRPTDIVLDIGSNCGTFAMIASRTAKQVYAIEPIYGGIILKNLAKNNITNIQILKIGLGEGFQNIRYGKIRKDVACFSFSQIKYACGGHIDFLKLDCEEGEWAIKPHELDGIRRIEAEVHNFSGFHNIDSFKTMLESVGFTCYIMHLTKNVTAIIHARREI